jgi:chorismate mutase
MGQPTCAAGSFKRCVRRVMCADSAVLQSDVPQYVFARQALPAQPDGFAIATICV